MQFSLLVEAYWKSWKKARLHPILTPTACCPKSMPESTLLLWKFWVISWGSLSRHTKKCNKSVLKGPLAIVLNTRKIKKPWTRENWPSFFSLQNWFLHLVKLHNTQVWSQTFTANDHFSSKPCSYCPFNARIILKQNIYSVPT